MKKFITILVGALAFWTESANAQVVPEIHYQFSIPTGTFRNFVEKPGPLGAGFQIRKTLPNNRISLGGGLSWFYFPDKKGKQTLELAGDDGTYTGFVTNYTNIYGLQFLAQYEFKEPNENRVPFVKTGLGLAYQNQRQDIGLFAFKYDGFQFMPHIETGMRFRLPRQGAINLSLTYHYLPGAGEVNATSFAGLRIGYSGFRIR